jgi:hypothetical protein
MARWSWQERAIGFAKQADLTSKATTGFDYFPAEVSIPDFVRNVEEFQFGTAQSGASEAPAVGGKHGFTFTLRFPLQSMKSGYDATTYTSGITAANDVIARTAVLLQHAIGGNTGGVSSDQDLKDGKLGYDESYDGDGIVSGTTGQTVVDAAPGGSAYDEGNFLFVSTATSDASPCQAFIKSISGDTLTHAEVSNNAGAASDKVWPTNTTPYTGGEPSPLTFRLLGDQTEFGIELIGCIPQTWTITLNAGMTPMCEISYVGTDRNYDTTIGGLQAKDAFKRLPPALGGQGAYASFGESGSAAVTCGLHDFSISGESDLHFVPCHGKGQGFSEVVVTNRRLTASVALPHDSTDTVTSGEHVHENRFALGTALSLGVFVGFMPGQVAAFFMPSWHIAEQPKLEDVEGVLYHRLALRAGEYTGDKTAGTLDADKAADTIFRIAFA